MPTNNFGQTYNNGVKYIKISTIDSGGLDQTNYLQQLQSLKINYDDLRRIEYNIITSQQKDNYFIFGIQPKVQSTSSVSYNEVSQSIAVRRTGSLTLISDDLAIIGWFGDQGVLPGFNLITDGNPNAITGTPPSYQSFNIFRTPTSELTLIITSSYSGTTIGDNLRVYLAQPNDDTGASNEIPIYTQSIPSTSGTLQFKTNTLNNFLLEGYYFLAIKNTYGGTFSNIRVAISQSLPSNLPSSSLTIFNPDFLDFDYNDYNALFGNAEQPQYSSKYMDVDYSSDPLTPVNFDLIISGTADRAQVQDSNYESPAWSDIRYNGSRYSSVNFNEPLARVGSLFNIQNLISGQPVIQNLNAYIKDNTYNVGYNSSTPCVEQNQTYMAFFEGVGGTGPEIIDQTAYFIKYLIDEQGNAVKPSRALSTNQDAISLYNLLNNFEPGKKATVKLIGNDPLSQTNPNAKELVGIHNITHVGRIDTILVSETGSAPNSYASFLSFSPTNNLIDTTPGSPDFAFKALKTANQTLTSNSNNKITAPNEIVTNAQYDNGTSVYTFTDNTSDYSNRVNFQSKGRFKFTFGNLTSEGYSTAEINVSLYKNYPDEILTTDIFSLETQTANSIQNIDFDISTGLQNFVVGDDITLYAKYTTDSSGATCQVLSQNFQFQAIPEYSSGSTTIANGPYWTVGEFTTGSNITTLTSSLSLFSNYGPTFTQIQSEDMLTMGFTKITSPFQLQKGDYIRIEYNPNKVFNVVDVRTEDRLYVDVFPPIPSGSILNHFVIYRIVNDGTYVVLDVKKSIPGSSFTGIIQPQFISSTLITKYDSIIADLTSKGIVY